LGQWHGVARALVPFWSVGSAIFFLAVALGILTQPNFPLSFGLVRTSGLAGLWATLLPAVVGLGGVLLVRRPGPLGAGLLLLYSAFWSVLLASGLPNVWNAGTSFCLNSLGVCITSPWIGRLVAMGLLAAFLLVGVWSWRVLTARSRTGWPSRLTIERRLARAAPWRAASNRPSRMPRLDRAELP